MDSSPELGSDSSSPLGSVRLIERFDTYRDRFSSPAANPSGSSLTHLPTWASYQRALRYGCWQSAGRLFFNHDAIPGCVHCRGQPVPHQEKSIGHAYWASRACARGGRKHVFQLPCRKTCLGRLLFWPSIRFGRMRPLVHLLQPLDADVGIQLGRVESFMP